MLPSRHRSVALVLVGAIALGGLFALLGNRTVVLAQPAGGQLSVYAKQSSYSVPMADVAGKPYVGLVELLEPLGTVDARVDGKKFKLRFSSPEVHELELQFQDGKDKGKVKGDGIKLSNKFVLQNNRGYVPLDSVSEILSRMLSSQVRLNASARRLFVGEAGQRFTLDLRSGQPSKLFISFDAPVNPTIATEAGHIRFTFKREPLLPMLDHVSYTDPLITGATFSEHDGISELDITGTSSLMANYADGGKTIVVTGVPAPPPPVAQQAPAPTETAPAAPFEPQSKPAGGARYLVLIDPAHGGTDIGAAIASDIAEKDLNLALARRLQRELMNRGIAAGLLRNSDIAIPLEQRAVSANAARPVLYVAIHAANTGSGVHVFTPMMEASGLGARDFLPWQRAQSAFVSDSSTVATAVAAELESRKLMHTLTPAPLSPMSSIAAPAFAVEIASPGENVRDIAGAKYLDQVAQSIAAGIAASRGKPSEAHR